MSEAHSGTYRQTFSCRPHPRPDARSVPEAPLRGGFRQRALRHRAAETAFQKFSVSARRVSALVRFILYCRKIRQWSILHLLSPLSFREEQKYPLLVSAVPFRLRSEHGKQFPQVMNDRSDMHTFGKSFTAAVKPYTVHADGVCARNV